MCQRNLDFQKARRRKRAGCRRQHPGRDGFFSCLLVKLSRTGVLLSRESGTGYRTASVHADLKHLLSNAIGLGVLSFLLYGYFGYKIYPCLILGVGAVVTLIAVMTYPPHTNLVGASGVIFLMAGFWLTLYVCLERRYSIGKRLVRAFGFFLIVLGPTTYSPQISYRTHAIGFGAGVLVAVVYFLANKDRFRFAEEVEIEWDDP